MNELTLTNKAADSRRLKALVLERKHIGGHGSA
jgi:hypothetical protein